MLRELPDLVSRLNGEPMKISFGFALVLVLSMFFASAAPAAEKVTFSPIKHASFVIQATGKVVYVDPVGDMAAYAGQSAQAIVLITHTHPDHFAPELVTSLRMRGAEVYGPKNAIEQLGFGEVIQNGETKTAGKITIEAVPAYNLTADRLEFHPKGRDNGYVVTMEGKRIYISGDTEDVPEVRALKKIDYAFLCMNLPYTMTVDQAASLAIAIKPKVVIPYHYRNKDGFSDLARFKELVAKEKGIEVREMKWY
jgi:L-ascorbate metabolism protein UlaG (beta-lactamase superfamily)